MNKEVDALDLDGYLARIEYGGPRSATTDTLRQLHCAHATHIPFENLDILLGKSIRLDLESLQAKMVRARRGGYCFEQNALFAAVLERLGFAVTRLAARVRFGTSEVRPRTHMALKVEADGKSWLADVGFGGWGLVEPIALIDGEDSRQGIWNFRLRREGEEWVLSCPHCPVGADQYSFTLEPQLPIDYEPPNHFCSTWPRSSFVQFVTVQRPSENVRIILRGAELSTADASGNRMENIEGDAHLLRVLCERFDLHFPEGTRFRSPNDQER